MEIAVPPPRVAGEQEWISNTDLRLRALLESEKPSAIKRVDPVLFQSIEACEVNLGHAPNVTPLIWTISSYMTDQSDDPTVVELNSLVEAFQSIQVFVAQTLQCFEAFKHELECRGLNSARVATAIWKEWIQNRSVDPITTSQYWLDRNHSNAGLGDLFPSNADEEEAQPEIIAA